jgi:hypothetical protein
VPLPQNFRPGLLVLFPSQSSTKIVNPRYASATTKTASSRTGSRVSSRRQEAQRVPLFTPFGALRFARCSPM